MKMEMYQNLWDAAKAVLTGKFIVINTYLKNKKSLKQPNFTPQRTRKRTNKAQSWQKEGNNKEQGRNNQVETKQTIEKIMKLRASSLKR